MTDFERYADGYRKGKLDRFIGTESLYLSHEGGATTQGYRDGIEGRAENNPHAPKPAPRRALDSEAFDLAAGDVRSTLTLARAFEVNRLRAMALGLRERTL